jgi:hypothetical protein
VSGEIANFSANFRGLFLRGIPCLLNDDGAYLAFGCIFSGTEALAGYRYPYLRENGVKFKNFLVDYFVARYHPLASELWDLRNSLIHSFSPKHFALCHGQPKTHLTDRPPYTKVLNAESFFFDFSVSAEKYLSSLATDAQVQADFQRHLSSAKGGGLYVG